MAVAAGTLGMVPALGRPAEPAAAAGSARPAGRLAFGQLTVQNLDGRDVRLAALLGDDGRAICLTFLYPHCPLAQKYGAVLADLSREFAPDGVRFVGVICDFDDHDDVTAYRDTFSIPFPLVTDKALAVAEAVDATVTPEAVLVDATGRVRYRGRIDDRYVERGVKSPGEPDPELENAIRDVLAGREVRVPVTEAVGCPLARPARPGATAARGGVTFYKDVLPFLHANCQRCHRPDDVGPFSLLAYDDAVDWLELGIEEIEARRMPPAQIESDYDFQGPRPPTAAEIATLRAWVAAGKPEGDPADAPRLPPLPDTSAFAQDLGPPDIVLEQPEPTQVGAHGSDIYRNIIFPLARDEDLRLRAIQYLPGNRRIVHHALIGHLPRETAQEAVRMHGGRDGFSHPDDRAGGFQDSHGIGFRVPPMRDDGQPRAAFVSGFVPGVGALAAPADAAVVIPAGCDITVQVHYVRTGKLETAASRVGLWLDKQPPRKVTNMIYLSGDFAVVPPGVTDFRVRGSYTLPQDADLAGVVPHAHHLARWIEITARQPGDAPPLLLLRVPQWDYNWQSPYVLERPRRFPAGTRFEAVVSYDNSAANPRNPFDPPQNVWHNETINDEMLLPMFTFTSDKPLDGKGDSFRKFYSTIVRSRFLRRLVDHRHKFGADPAGNVTLSPDYDPDDHRY